jgi:hypothetical protein
MENVLMNTVNVKTAIKFCPTASQQDARRKAIVP